MKLYPAVVNGIKQPNYYVDDSGNFWSSKKGDGKARMLSPGLNSNGYLTVNLSYNGKAKSYQLHRIVAETLIPFPKPEGIPKEDWKNTPNSVKSLLVRQYLVNHIDHDKENYHPSNLEWVTSKGNAQARDNHYKKVA